MQTSHPPKIKVVQYMYGGHEYFLWDEKINRVYCQRHGYDHVIVRNEPLTDRHIAWQKIKAIIQELHGCDYLLYLDSDAIFYSHELTVENELIPLMEDRDILMAEDYACQDTPWTPGLPNSGVILMRVNDRVREFFTFWDAASDVDELSRWEWPVDQKALWTTVMPKFPEMVNVHPEYYLMNGWFGLYIRHYMTFSDAERAEKMKAFCESRNIDTRDVFPDRNTALP